MSLCSIRQLRAGYRQAGTGYQEVLKGIDLDIDPGETVAVVGASGCGKSTFARCLTRLQAITSGSCQLADIDWFGLSHRQLRQQRWRVQMVFQDPDRSLDPRWTLGQSIAETMQERGNQTETALRVKELLDAVGLSEDYAYRYPHQCSGGQKQRIGIARALAARPQLLIADEAVSALDVSVQAQVLNLLRDLQARFGFGQLFISHDLAVVRHIANQIAVMDQGTIVEQQSSSDIFTRPQHETTKALLHARLDPP